MSVSLKSLSFLVACLAVPVTASMAVTRGNETLVERARGLADVANARRAEPSTSYRVGSLSKQFTAALLLRLVDRGRLSLSDTLGRCFDDLEPELSAITAEQRIK